MEIELFPEPDSPIIPIDSFSFKTKLILSKILDEPISNWIFSTLRISLFFVLVELENLTLEFLISFLPYSVFGFLKNDFVELVSQILPSLTNIILSEILLIRFKLYTDQYLRQDGFYFDEFKILGFSENLNTSNFQNDHLFIYPTIVENNVKIKSYKNISKILVHNSIGKKVLELNENNITEINLNNIDAGIYFIKLFDGNNFITKKLIKK